MSTTTPHLLGVRTAAQQLGVHENTLRRWEQSGLLRAVRLPSGVRRFRADDIAKMREDMFGPNEGLDQAISVATRRSRAAR
jgi:excisionase family DNA binding protein